MFQKMIEITTMVGCRINCRYCPQKLLVNSYYQLNKGAYEGLTAINDSQSKRQSKMSFEVFKKCIDKIPQDVDIHFSGMCEPWQNPDCTKMLIYASQKQHRVHIFTTLQGMSVEDYLQLKNVSIESFVLHIPDAKGNSTFDLSESYMRLLNIVISDAMDNNFKIKSCSCHGSIHPKIKDLILNSKIPVYSQMNNRAGNVCTSEIEGAEPIKAQSIRCKWCNGNSLDKNVLLPDGTVLLCCMDYGMDFPLGNLLYQDYTEISEGQVKRQYRELLDINKKSILCRNCHRAISLDDWKKYQSKQK